MKNYECIAHIGNTGKQIVIFVRAFSASTAQMDFLKAGKTAVWTGSRFGYYRQL